MRNRPLTKQTAILRGEEQRSDLRPHTISLQMSALMSWSLRRHAVPGRARKDRAAHGVYRARDLILGYYDAYATAAPSALQTWLGPQEKRTARRHDDNDRAGTYSPSVKSE